jgi:outer membrane protein assembly factor BamA
MGKYYRQLKAGGLIFTLLFLPPLFVFSAEKSAEKEKQFGFIFLPVIFYMPETKLAAGAGGLITYRSRTDSPLTRPSSCYFYAVYTQLRQFIAQVRPEVYWNKEKYYVSFLISAENFPDKFWGVGNKTPDEAEESYTPRSFSFELIGQRKIWSQKKMYLGLQGRLEQYKIIKFEPEGLLAREIFPGSRRGKTVSLGIMLSLDTRNNIFFPTSGHFYQFSATFSPKFLGSDFEKSSVRLDLRKYEPLFSGHVLSWQFLFQAIGGNPGFRQYATLGGDMIMRGYYSGRYRDKCLLAFQAEYRLPLWKRLGLVGFAGLGEVASSMTSFQLKNFKYSYGFGLRFKILPREGTNLRLDFAWGKKTSGIYFSANEAF